MILIELSENSFFILNYIDGFIYKYDFYEKNNYFKNII